MEEVVNVSRSRVTVCVPTFKRPELLEVALRSAIAQTVTDIEILVGDNGGLPETSAVIDRLADSRIRLVTHETNLGMMGNWVWLMTSATTPYVASLHDDDQWEPTFLEQTLHAMERHPEVSMVFTSHTIVDQHGEAQLEVTRQREANLFAGLRAGLQSTDPSEALHRAFVLNAPQPAYAALIKAEAVRSVDFPVEAGPVYDLWLTYQLGCQGRSFSYVPERLTRYRVWPGSATQSGELPQSEDWLFNHVLTHELAIRPDVRDQIAARWASLRFSRAMRQLAEPTASQQTQTLLRTSAPDLSGFKRAIAIAGGSSSVVLSALRVAQKGRRWASAFAH